MKENILKDKTFKFAIRIINLYKYLKDNKKEFVLSKQILRSGTAIGALVNEAIQAESKLDFIHKLSISNKEAYETDYWLKLLVETDFIEKSHFDSIYEDLEEILKLLTSIIKTTKLNLENTRKN